MSGWDRTGRRRIASAVQEAGAFWAAMRDGWESSNAAEVPPAPFNRSLRDKPGLVFGTIFLSPFLDSLWVATAIETAGPTQPCWLNQLPHGTHKRTLWLGKLVELW